MISRKGCPLDARFSNILTDKEEYFEKTTGYYSCHFLTATATGCGNRNGNINLYREEFEVNVGSGISTELKDYVRAPKRYFRR